MSKHTRCPQGHLMKRLMNHVKPYYWCSKCKYWIHVDEYKLMKLYYDQKRNTNPKL